MRVENADSRTNVTENTRYTGTRETDSTNGLTSGQGGVAHDNAHVQNRNAGSTDKPNTTVSTTMSEMSVQRTRVIRASGAFTARSCGKTYHRKVGYEPRVAIEGEGPPVILVPGLDGTGLLFYRQTERLARGYRVVTFRLRDTADTMDTLVADLNAVIDELQHDERTDTSSPPIVIGESFGGALALSYALVHPRKVSRLVVLNSFPRFTPQHRLWLAHRLLQRVPWGMMRIVRHLTAFRMHSRHTGRDEIQKFHELMRHTTREGYLSRLSILRRYDVRHRLSMLDVPTLFLAADCDHLVPAVSQAELMASLAPHSAVRILKGHGHICLIAPDVDLSEILSEWVAPAPIEPDASDGRTP